ncbi:MAG: phosphoenolpyruvate--protein phosphotransferase [SAR324 cluster bacterium]|nr:phosphoenolpyruvate--protein phosphotransferase [SAR324 cluster bacterium]
MSDDRLSAKNISPLQTLADISHVITGSHDAVETLFHTAEMIAERLLVDACSIYVYDSEEEKLVLRATYGLNSESVGQVQMKPSEGLIGLVLETSEPVQVAEMQEHPRFKSFPQTDEDLYRSFLGVPLIQHRKAFGVLGMHTIESRTFTKEEEHMLVTIASQISGMISKALLIERLKESPHTEVPPAVNARISGVPVAAGVALGQAVLLQENVLEEPEKNTLLTPEEELATFAQVFEKTTIETLELIDKVSNFLGADEAAIFHAHLMFLEDHGFQGKIEKYILGGASAAWSIFQVIQEYLRAFEAIDDPYLRERGTDLKDMGFRLMHNLGYGQVSLVNQDGILVTKQLLPADVAQFDSEKIKGIVTSAGGAASHAAILARSRFIPAICISEEAIETIHEGDTLAVDGEHGYMVINPGNEVLTGFQQLLLQQKEYLSYLDGYREKKCQTVDGHRIHVLANIGLVSETYGVHNFGAEGIGLYRSEIFFLSLDHYPSVEEQVEVYSKIVESVDEHQMVVFRTLDIGADKCAPYMGVVQEENPFLGNRAIREQMGNPEILKKQIKAILIAASRRQSDHKGRKNVSLIYPMISHLNEIRFCNRLFSECRKELQEEGVEVPGMAIGMMFEIPAAVIMVESFISEIDFLSIGSNDLTQYILAVDRNNPHVAHLYDPLHPSVLNMIKILIECANRHNKPIELCGEMAADPDGCIILIGMGLRYLSMAASLIPVVKERLSFITLKEAEELAEKALQASSAEQVRNLVATFFKFYSSKTTA